jgi:hypothetical protein
MDIKLTGILSTSLLSQCITSIFCVPSFEWQNLHVLHPRCCHIVILSPQPCVQSRCLQDGTIGMDIKLTGILSTSLLSCCHLITQTLRAITLLAGRHHWHGHQADRHSINQPAITMYGIKFVVCSPDPPSSATTLLAGRHHRHRHQADRHPVDKPAVTLYYIRPVV